MNFPIKEGISTLKKNGLQTFTFQAANHLGIYRPIWNTITSRRPVGTNIFERKWDLLVILDTCRPDYLARCAESVDWLTGVGEIQSVGSMSAEWMLQTFTEEHSEQISETALLSENIWSYRILEEEFHKYQNHNYDMIHAGYPRWNPVSVDSFGHYELIYPSGNQDDRLHPEAGHIPHILTDRAIDVGRQKDFDRLIVHYNLPHLRHIADAIDWEPGEKSHSKLMAANLPVARDLRPEERSFDSVNQGEVPAKAVRDNYLKNLRFCLEYVGILLENMDADKVVISADHGEGLGDRGVLYHPFGCPFSEIKTVPWAITTADDQGTYVSKYEDLNTIPNDREIRGRLKALGYL